MSILRSVYFVLILATSIASTDVISSFMANLDTSLSLLPEEEARKAFVTVGGENLQSSESNSLDIDRYYVCLKEGTTVPKFLKSVPFWPKFRYLISTDFVGGQTQCLIVVCKVQFLKHKSVSKMVSSYVPFPRITWVDKHLIETLAKSINANDELSITVRSQSEAISIDTAAKVAYATFQTTSNEAPSSSSIMHYLLQQSDNLVSSSAVTFTSEVHSEVDDRMMVKGSAASLLRIVAGLLKDDSLKTIEVTPRFRPTEFLRTPQVEKEASQKETEPSERRLNDFMRMMTERGNNPSSQSILDKYNLHGKNVIVGVGDTGLDMKSTFFYDAEHTVKFGKTMNSDHRKVAMYYDFENQVEDETEGHGTHVCGILAGKAADSSVSTYNGLAYDARIAFYDLGDAEGNLYTPVDLYNYYLDVFYQNGVRIVSNSWGSVDKYTYSERCYDIDKFIWENNDMLVLFSAGNDGEKGFNTVGEPSLAKNIITVGATYGNKYYQVVGNLVTYYSGRGENNSGRYLPTLVAIGDELSAKSLSVEDCGHSCTNHIDTTWMQGTSMAAPAAAAATAIITQYLKEGRYHGQTVDIRASLIKAMMVHSTVSTDGFCDTEYCFEYPSSAIRKYYEGFGLVQLNNVLHFDDSPFELFLYYGQINDKKSEVKFTIPLKSRAKVVITMAYTDVPVSSYSKNVMGNDLDVTVGTPGSSVVYYGNGAANGDRKNNVEKIIIAGAEYETMLTSNSEDVIEVIVKKYSLTTDYQPFSLVITGDFDYSSVQVTDNTSTNYDDKPQSQKGKESNDISLIALILALCCWCFL